eukprot:scaffold1353_cov161-Amphora_coffeaeformis.AAC.42
MKNPLLSRRQSEGWSRQPRLCWRLVGVSLDRGWTMIVDIIHPGRANVPKKELQDVVGGMYKADAKLVVLFGFRTKFGGGKSTGFCLIYDSEDAMRKFEPKHRVIRAGMAEKKEQSRKAIKEAKNKGLKIRGTGASIAKHKAKRAAGNE